MKTGTVQPKKHSLRKFHQIKGHIAEQSFKIKHSLLGDLNWMSFISWYLQNSCLYRVFVLVHHFTGTCAWSCSRAQKCLIWSVCSWTSSQGCSLLTVSILTILNWLIDIHCQIRAVTLKFSYKKLGFCTKPQTFLEKGSLYVFC